MHPSPDAAFQRGRLLQSQHRLADAVASYKQALEIDPHHTPSFIMLALCWLQDEARAPEALDAAKRAVALAPEDAFARSVLALAMDGNAKEGQTAAIKLALAEAQAAVSLDPDSDFSHAVLARLHLRLRDNAKAEAAARAALALDTDNAMAAEVLSVALLRQRKDEDHQDLVRSQLHRDPDDDSAHAAAGWQALMSGRHQDANRHFLEALRLNPMNEAAREGLIESYRARSFFYNAFLRYSHWMNRFTEGRQNLILIGGFIGYRILSESLKSVSPLLANAVVGVWLVFALWSHLARGLSTFLITLDRTAWQALRQREFWEGTVVGWLIVAAIATVALGYGMAAGAAGFAAMSLLLASLVNAAAFTNDHHLGKPIYHAAGAVAGIGALYLSGSTLGGLNLPLAELGGVAAILLGVAVSWLRMLRVLYA